MPIDAVAQYYEAITLKSVWNEWFSPEDLSYFQYSKLESVQCAAKEARSNQLIS